MSIIVDGYNFIFTNSDRDRRFDMEEPQTARGVLISKLSKYRTAKGTRVAVVFDGGAEAARHPASHYEYGVEVIFSDATIDADTEIKRMLGRSPDPGAMTVVSSDREVQTFARRVKAKSVDSREFYERLEETLKRGQESGADEPMSKYEGPSRADAAYWEMVFRDDFDRIQELEADDL